MAVLLILFGHRQLLTPLSFDSQDHVDGYVRALEYSTEWHNGHWAQTLPNAYHGGGDAFPRFYPPISHITASAIYEVVRNPITAVHLSGLIALTLSCVFQALLVFRLTGNAFVAGVAGAAFLLSPYTFVQLQVRGTFAEAWGAAWYPLVVLAALWTADNRRMHPVYPIAIGLLMLSHTVMTLWVLPVLLVVIVVSQQERLRATRDALVAVTLGALLAGFHLISVGLGTSGLRAAESEVLHTSPEAIMAASQRYGLTELPSILFPVMLFLGLITGVRALHDRTGERTDRICRLALATSFLLASMLVAPETVWAALPAQLRYLQFTARLLSPISFLLSLALAISLARIRLERYPLILGPLLIAGLSYAFLAGRHALMPRTLDQARVRGLVHSEFSAEGFNVDQAFLPRHTTPREIDDAVLRLKGGIGQKPLRRWDASGPDPVAVVELDHPGAVTVPLVAYDFLAPRTADGSPIGIGSDQGLLSLTLPAGTHTIIIGRRIPPLIAGAMTVSAVTLVLLLVLTARAARRSGS